MAYLINRNPPARLQCLHGLCKLIYNLYGLSKNFRMSNLKYDPHKENIHSYCTLLIENNSLGIKYCPYKENPLNTSGCSLTNGVDDDTTKSKEVSNTVNALHALGFINRTGNILQLTKAGANFSNVEFDSIEMLPIIRKAVLRYGLFVGLMFQLHNFETDEFDTDEIFVGYPHSNENVIYQGETVKISSGSEDDSNTRTKSCMLAWATTAGFIYPVSLLESFNSAKPHVSSSSYILSKNRNLRKYKIMHIPGYLFDGSFITERPLEYKNLTKNTGALRENNQQIIRELSLKLEPKIQNRRFAIAYLLNEAFKQKKTLALKKLVEFLLRFPELFVIDKKSFYNTICQEVNIGFMAGIPFEIVDGEDLRPVVGINIDELSLRVPNTVIEALNKFN